MKKVDRIRYLLVVLLVIVAGVSFVKCWDVKYVLKDQVVLPDGGVDYFVSRVNISSQIFNPKFVMLMTLIECCLVVMASRKRFIILGFVINLIKFIVPFSRYSIKESIYGSFGGLNVEESISRYYLGFYIIAVLVCIIAILYVIEFIRLCVDKNKSE
ncbi:MAG: hypothetical protein UF228_10435 [Lachnospiraceae bacterium]|nr:hypothetical protein [Lachnospiraceae bacterium]